ncbi:basic amino acid ABC transporter substrate-binding protein [Bacillus sp. 165]|uniref:basic amino acid ABC transporter substrate-binding protein n=1 Tax=Bacillus sp. 165 TaxID=1529117 RepID=UPI001ADC32FD|nr:basic amino acid ABC transporter substrate-binding protein [Bacillus sp. 165]MBO9129324.1 basic amino acid ABC transporter substrate-binding protein [Bacillus sp. 165]
MKLKSKIVSIVSTLLLAASFAGCSSSASTNEDKVITVGTDAAYAPFEYLEKGKVVGFDADFLAAVMEEAGIKYKLKNTGWDPLFASLNTGEIDMGISAITINDDRKKTYDFSSPYFESTQMIMVKEGSPVKNATDLKGLKVGVQNGTTGQAAAEQILGEKNEKIAKYESNVLAIMALQNGEVDAVVADNTVVEEYVKNNPENKLVAISDKDNFEPEYYGLMFKKGNKLRKKMDAAVQEVIANGTYADIYKKWFKTEPNVEALKQQ